MEGIIFDIQKFCVHDGPGIRTSVFFKGCNMRCLWCHNPESYIVKPQISFDASKCVYCNKCGVVCELHRVIDENHIINRAKCDACGKCVAVCPQKAICIIGKNLTVNQVVLEVIKDKKYYETSGGGVTITGGEATVQFDFLLSLLQQLKKEGLHICLETNGYINKDKLIQIISYIDLFLLDYKASGEDYEKLTGVKVGKVIETLNLLEENKKNVILRCPIVQGVNDKEEHFAEINRLKNYYKIIQSAEIMPYHNTGKHKWGNLGLLYSLSDMPSASKEQADIWRNKIN